MSHEGKDPTTVPERARLPRDATVLGSAGGTGGSGAASSASVPAAPLVASQSSVAAIVADVRKAPAARLEVESRIAAGGMGVIEIAVDRALDRRIAIKTLHPHLARDEAALRMFLREARLTALLDHPHIVPLYDIAEREGGSLFFAMKLVEGQTLAAIIRALPRGPLDTATLYALLDVVAKVCDALAFAHSRGVLHCDVKPGNVMVGEFGQVYLMDWGIARIAAAEPEAGSIAAPALDSDPDIVAESRRSAISTSATDNSVIGTPCYMSPEQARGDRQKLDPRSDVFSLGAMLYELLTRRPPYASTDRHETLALASACAFPSPRKVAGDAAVPPELDRIVMRAMAKAPSDRYATVSALREDLVRFMRGGAEFPRRSFAAGSVIVREGETGDAAYIIFEGRCAVRKELPSGTQTLQTLRAGDVFGEMAILSPGPRTATVVALEDTTLLVVTASVLEEEMAALKPWMATLLKSLANRFRDIDTAHRATYSSTPSLARLANQVLMHLVTWGEEDGKGGRSMAWSRLSVDLEAQLGFAPLAIFGVINRYGLVLDVDTDRLIAPDVAGLTARLRRELDRTPAKRNAGE